MLDLSLVSQNIEKNLFVLSPDALVLDRIHRLCAPLGFFYTLWRYPFPPLFPPLHVPVGLDCICLSRPENQEATYPTKPLP
jgi:hypothetical protein